MLEFCGALQLDCGAPQAFWAQLAALQWLRGGLAAASLKQNERNERFIEV